MTDAALAARIGDLAGRLDALRPLSRASLQSLDDWYDYELTYTSNALEGNTLTLRETTLVIEKGITIGGRTVAEHLEAQDHFAAVKDMRRMAAGERSLTEDDMLALHAAILRRSQPGVAGTYAAHARRIQGSRIVLPRPEKIPSLMATFASRLAVATAGWRSAFEAHFELVTIHPFADGNGRTARLLMNLILLRGGYPPVAIGPEHRAEYLAVLEARQIAEPLGHEIVDPASRAAYVDFMARRLVASLEDHLAVLDPDDPSCARVDDGSSSRLPPQGSAAGRC